MAFYESSIMSALLKFVCRMCGAAALFAAIGLMLSLAPGTAAAQTAGITELRLAHHLPDNPDDWRHAYTLAFAAAVAKADVGLKVTVFPDQRLVPAREQWGALVRGAIDLSMFAPAELAVGAPEVQALGLPAMIRDVAHARRLGESPFMVRLRQVMDDRGVTALDGGVWLPGAVGSARHCMVAPPDLLGLAMRTSSQALDRLFQGLGALTVSLPSSELPRGLRTGALDAATFPVASFVSSNIRNEIRCLTLPGDGGALFVVYAPIMASRAGMARLTEAQRAALHAAAVTASTQMQAVVDRLADEAEGAFAAAGVKVVRLDAAALAAWRAGAETTAYADFAGISPVAAELLGLMRNVR